MLKSFRYLETEEKKLRKILQKKRQEIDTIHEIRKTLYG